MTLQGSTVIYGGSFNPPHLGHQMACLYLLEGLCAEAVWLVPAGNHPFGKRLVDFDHRVAMCELLAAPLGDRVAVQRVEEEKGLSGKTYDTVAHLCASFPERKFVLAVGADILAETPQWHRWADLEALVPIVVMGRGGYQHERAAGLQLPEVSSSEVRRRVAREDSLEGYVPASVAAYVAQHRLYRT